MAHPGLVLYTEAHLIIGQVDPGRRHLSDHLNDARTSYLDVQQATWYDLLAEEAPPTTADLVTVRKAAVQLAIPQDPPNATGAGARIATQQVRMALAFALFAVAGNVHRRPGDPTNLVGLFGGETRQFVPVSAASIRYLPNGRFDTEEPVVLVHTRHLDF